MGVFLCGGDVLFVCLFLSFLFSSPVGKGYCLAGKPLLFPYLEEKEGDSKNILEITYSGRGISLIGMQKVRLR